MRIVSRFILLVAASVFALAALAPEPLPEATGPSPRSAKGSGHGDFFMGRLKYGNNRGSDCGEVGKDLIKIVSGVLTVRVQEERKIFPTDPDLFETPFLFMNGHNDFVFSEADVEALRIYFSHGGFLLASECCTNPEFPKAWRREFSRIFPSEPLRKLPYSHPIYRSFYKIERIPCLHEKRDVLLDGLFCQGNLVAVMCDEGLCCAYAMNGTCNAGRGVSPDDAKKLALNIAVYAMTH